MPFLSKALGATALAAALAACTPNAAAPKAAEVPAGCVLDGLDKIGGPIALISAADKKQVTEADFAGRPTLVYFGYASCPDVCPLSLQNARAALDQMEAGSSVQTVLVTVDPERDTAETMASYVQAGVFPPNLIGLTGSREAVDAAAKAFRVYHAKALTPDSAMGYLVDHSDMFYLMDGNWRTMALFRGSSQAPEDMAQCMNIALAKS